jgi:hypothetical protein
MLTRGPKKADRRLPADLQLITNMIAHLWEQVWIPVWTKIILPWLQQTGVAQPTVQDWLAILPSEDLRAKGEAKGLVQRDVHNLRKLLQLELSFLNQEMWFSALVSEFTLITSDRGQRCYTF